MEISLLTSCFWSVPSQLSSTSLGLRRARIMIVRTWHHIWRGSCELSSPISPCTHPDSSRPFTSCTSQVSPRFLLRRRNRPACRCLPVAYILPCTLSTLRLGVWYLRESHHIRRQPHASPIRIESCSRPTPQWLPPR
ncbi:hypothetical protein CORC01_05801 [Colletotrichum orchidophilum]|uniref:Uncharacterized protein n=1 Tax=Colletotrichum orchidophilum TaxID=1209926 RepID=A0A1G4BC37_9PEZI|nr:uncharacterized protein CORC01_05801 [Colletotrichum orchidophilum]OHE98905.1 hypothetical protein CORC01_05801 [Colletotrichum orchidophilum]